MNTQSGNALWFILIAVVLLGLLTIVLSRGSSSVDQSGDIEQLRIKASQIMRYTKAIESAVQNALLNGCSENDINFENATDTDYENTGSPDGGACDIFHVRGAGLEWRVLSEERFTSTEALIFSGAIAITGVGDDAQKDLLALVPVTRNLCTQINKERGNSVLIADITSDIAAYTKFTGSFTGSDTLGNGAGKAPGLTGKQAGCFIDANGDYVSYLVLIAR